jgi:hypothetical protein
MFSDSQAITTTARSNWIDTLAYRDIGTGMELEVYLMVDETVTAAGSSTVTFALQCDDNSAFSSATTLYTTAAIAKATLVAGYKVFDGVKIPRGCERYVSILYTVASGPNDTGKFNAGIVLASQSWRAYPNAI